MCHELLPALTWFCARKCLPWPRSGIRYNPLGSRVKLFMGSSVIKDAGDDRGRALLRRARAGDEQAFEALVRLYTPRLYRMVRRWTGDSVEAENLVQETWLRTWRRLPHLSDDRDPFPWLARVATNLARDQWRKRRPLAFADLSPNEREQVVEGPGPEGLLDQKQQVERLRQAVRRLRPEYRMVIALRYDGQLSYQQIAEAMDLPLNTVRTYIHRAKAELRAMLEGRNV